MDYDWCSDITTKRKSLIHNESDTKAFAFISSSKLISTDGSVKLTHVFKGGHGPDSVFLDITERKETIVKILQLIARQYPSRNGILVRRDKGIHFLEINFGVRDPDLNAILEKGVTFKDESVVVPCLARQVNAVYVRLYNLLLLDRHNLRGVILSSLLKFGNAFDVGMLLELSTNTYMGSGYAIVDTK